MDEITTIGLDIAKSVFQVHGIDASGEGVVRRQLRRRQVLPFFRKLPSCVIGIEACATAHHWGRELEKVGHEVRLMPARYVKPYVKRNKNDAADAEAICEAVTRPTMRFVPIKSPEQQSVLMLHRTRQLFVRQRTALINAIRAHLAEFGIVAGVGRNGVEKLLELIAEGEDERIPPVTHECLMALAAQLAMVKRQILEADRRVLAWHRASNPRCRPINRLSPCCQHPRSKRLPFRPRPECLDRAGAETELNRRQGASRLHLEGGQPVSAIITGRWRIVSHPTSQTVGLHTPPMAGRAHGAPVRQDCRRRTG